MSDMTTIAAKYQALSARLDEATLRTWAATEARSLGRGGVSLVAKATGLSRTTIHVGLSELKVATLRAGAAHGRACVRWTQEVDRQGCQSAERARCPGGAHHARRSDVGAALDVQEHASIGRRTPAAGPSGQPAHRLRSVDPSRFQPAIDAQDACRRTACGPGYTIHAHRSNRRRVSGGGRPRHCGGYQEAGA